MSFRLFVYYCAIVGAWSGFVGWALGRVVQNLSPEQTSFFTQILVDSFRALCLGFAVALGLSFLDASFNYSLRRIGIVLLSVATAVFIGIFGGMCSGILGGSIFYFLQYSVVFLVSWIFVGVMVGLSVGAFQLIMGIVTKKDLGSAIKKVIKCDLGGTIGGMIGGAIALALGKIAELVFVERAHALWTPTALGFIAIGACIGLLVGLAQVMLKEAWIRVEAGFRPGREMLLQKETTTIGRAEGSDIALFGDSGVEKAHANIVKEGGRYYLVDLQTPGGTYVNDQKVEGRTPLKAGDLIRVGKSVLRFNERTKRRD
mgnify:CR=1 FL=1